jgi:hypothetical protein
MLADDHRNDRGGSDLLPSGVSRETFDRVDALRMVGRGTCGNWPRTIDCGSRQRSGSICGGSGLDPGARL